MWLRSVISVDAKDLPGGATPADHGLMNQIANTTIFDRTWASLRQALRDIAPGRRGLDAIDPRPDLPDRSEEHTSELQSLMRISYAVFCLKKTNQEHSQTQ